MYIFLSLNYEISKNKYAKLVVAPFPNADSRAGMGGQTDSDVLGLPHSIFFGSSKHLRHIHRRSREKWIHGRCKIAPQSTCVLNMPLDLCKD